MIPNYQTLMRPVLECAADGETRIADAIEHLGKKLGLSAEDQSKLLPRGRQTVFANRVAWAKTYLVKAGLAEGSRGAYFPIQNVEKISPSRSSADNVPTMLPRCRCVARSSSAISSGAAPTPSAERAFSSAAAA